MIIKNRVLGLLRLILKKQQNTQTEELYKKRAAEVKASEERLLSSVEKLNKVIDANHFTITIREVLEVKND